MELKVRPYTPPEALNFNYEELKSGLLEKASHYESVVYTDDQVQVAKEDRAALNKLKKALNDERIRQEREYMKPFATFKAQINEIIGIIDRPIAAIDAQVKELDERRKAEKRKSIDDLWQKVLQANRVPAAVCFSHVFDDKWLNASVSINTIKKEMDEKLGKMAADLAIIRDLSAYSNVAENVYLSTLNLAQAISAANEIKEKAAYEESRKAKEEASRCIAPTPGTEPKREWIAFQALLTPDEAKALGDYMKNNGIQYKAV